MAKTFYLCWIEDIPGFIRSLDGHIELLEADHDVKFVIDEHHDTNNFDSIARNISDDLFFLVDFNLKRSNGTGIDGDEVIRLIRKENQNCRIIFYSSKATQEELRELIGDTVSVSCVIRENLRDLLTDIADGSFTN